jgi:hypothetical protein
VKEIVEVDEGNVTMAVDFSVGDDHQLTWMLPDDLELLHVGDLLDSIIIECYEGTSEALIGSCRTSLGALTSGRSNLHLLTTSTGVSYPFKIETFDDRHANSFSMGRSRTLRARSSTQCHNWIKSITEGASKVQALARYQGCTSLQYVGLKLQDIIMTINYSHFFIAVVYLAIILSFVGSIVQTEVVPTRPDKGHPGYAFMSSISNAIETVEIVVTVVFTVDLLSTWWPTWAGPFLLNL